MGILLLILGIVIMLTSIAIPVVAWIIDARKGFRIPRWKLAVIIIAAFLVLAIGAVPFAIGHKALGWGTQAVKEAH